MELGDETRREKYVTIQPEIVMPHYFMHLHEHGDVAEDTQGQSALDMDDAIDAAADQIRQLMASDLVEKHAIDTGGWVDLVERDTAIRVTIPFRLVLRISR